MLALLPGACLYAQPNPEAGAGPNTQSAMPAAKPQTACLSREIEYTPAAMRAKIQCSVGVGFFVESNGRTSEAFITESCGETPQHKQLDRVVLQAMKTCPAEPSLDAESRPMRSRGSLIITFSLDRLPAVMPN
ncbi:TonB family protein [Ideonella paludis]